MHLFSLLSARTTENPPRRSNRKAAARRGPGGRRSPQCERLEKRELLAADINEGGIGQFYYVDVSGNDNSSGQIGAPFATLAQAVTTAINGPLANGTKTKIIVNNGTYTNQPNAGLWTDDNSFPVWPGQAAETVLVIEGQSAEGVTFQGVDNDFRQITFEGKSNLVLRDLAFRDLDSNFEVNFWGAVHLQANPDEDAIGRFGPGRGHDLLLDNIEVTGSDRRGGYVALYDDVTIIDSNFDDNINRVGLQLQDLRDVVVERTSISRNGDFGAPPDPNDFGNSGLQFAAINTTLRNVTANQNQGSGIRMDFQAENVLIVDSNFNNNQTDGVFFETAYGPVTLDNVTLNDNGRAGVHLATTQDFTIENSTIIGNGRAGVMVTEQRRDESNWSSPTFLWAQDPAFSRQNYDSDGSNDPPITEIIGGRPMNWNTNTVVRNTTIEATDADAVIYSSGYDNSGTWENHYDDWISDNFTGSNNSYAATRDDAFNDSTRSGARTFVDFQTWRSLSGSDSSSTFDGPSTGGPGDTFGEVGTVSRRQNSAGQWHNVSFTESFNDPIVVLGALSRNGGDQAVGRVRNVTSTGFQWQIDEWDYLDGAHTNETVDWIAVERGTHTLADGTTFVAGSVDINHNWRNVSIPGFTSTPVVFSQVASRAGGSAVTTRMRFVDSDSFQVRLQEEEANDGVHVIETVTYIAVENGVGDGLQAAVTPNAVTASNYNINFDASVVANPAVFAQMQTFDGPDTATTRLRARNANGVTVNIEEERSADTELGHTTEAVGYLALAKGPLVTAGGGGGGVTPQIDNASFESGLNEWTATGNVGAANFGGTSDGNSAAVFNSGNDVAANGVLSQEIATTSGQTYRVIFDFRAGGNSSFQSRINARALSGSSVLGQTTQTLNGTPGGSSYTTYSYEFTADGNLTTLQFRDQSPDVNGIDAWLDNIRIELV